MQRLLFAFLLGLGLVVFSNGHGLRALKGQQQEVATRAGAQEEQEQNTTTNAAERPVAGNQTTAQANATRAGERPVNASEANTTSKHSTFAKKMEWMIQWIRLLIDWERGK
jgi:hypothetical protein